MPRTTRSASGCSMRLAMVPGFEADLIHRPCGALLELARRGLRTVFVTICPNWPGPTTPTDASLTSPVLRSGEQVDGERHHVARTGLGQQRRCNRDCPPRPYRVVHQQHRPVEAHPVAHAGAGQQVPRPNR